MRVGIYNKHWFTLGGGEQLAAGVAVALARDNDVELLVNEEFDPIVACDRLGVDLTPLPQREISMGMRAFVDVTAEYDLLVNSSFTSISPSRAGHSIYYVHFPVPFPDRSRLRRVLHAATDRDPFAGSIERHWGFWIPEFAGNGSWTDGNARMDLVIPRGVRLPLSFRLDANAWPMGRSPAAKVTVGDVVVFSGVIRHRRPVRVRTGVTGRGIDDPIPVWIESDSFVPRLTTGSDDDRLLGLVVSRARLGQQFAAATRLGDVLRHDTTAPEIVEFLDSYQLVAANSEYTSEWVERLWGRTATVLAPPVLMRVPGQKRPIILAVGRFFPKASGHSKKQLELVHAFRIACEHGLAGWELHLVGGCKPEERRYVEEVRRAAVGLPVKFHVNARGDDVAELFAAARLFWHGSGIGEDRERHPDRLEHFGITVVEAMSAGAVPLVYAHGGPAAIVRRHGCGRVFSNIEELAASTIELARAPDELDRLGGLAAGAAHEFAFDRFGERTRELVARVIDGAPRVRS